MRVAQLIAALQALPQDLEVVVCHPAQCCCGDCFLPTDEYSEPDPHRALHREPGSGSAPMIERVEL